MRVEDDMAVTENKNCEGPAKWTSVNTATSHDI